MEPEQYLRAIRQRLVAVVLIAVAVTASVAGYTVTRTPVYESSATVFLSPSSGRTVLDLVQGSNFAQDLVDSYAQIASMPIVVDRVVEQLDLTSADSWSVDAEALLDTVLIEITAASTDPQQAADIANATAVALGEAVGTLSPAAGDTGESIEISVVRDAVPSGAPASPQTRRNILAGAILGVVLGLGYAVLRELLDTRIDSDEDVARATSAPVLANVERGPRDRGADHPFATDPRAVESYRRLRTNVDYYNYNGHMRTLLVTSPSAGDGKTTTAVNLAYRMAATEKRVLLIDADLHKGSMAELMGLPREVGLSPLLTGRVSLTDALQSTAHPRLDFLASGDTPPNSSELLGSERMQELLAEAAATYDFVVIDAPPTLPITDPVVLARFCDGVLLVVRWKRTTRAALKRATSLLRPEASDTDTRDRARGGAGHIVGVVINGVRRRRHDPSYGEGYYGEASATTRSGPSTVGRTKLR